MRKIPILLAISLVGCAHTVAITSRSTGVTARTTVPASSSGQISVVINGRTYRGPWVYVPEGGGVSMMSGYATSGIHTASLMGTGLMMPTNGNGQASLTAADGSHIRCVFSYNEWYETGMGECQGNDGEMYDVQIGS